MVDLGPQNRPRPAQDSGGNFVRGAPGSSWRCCFAFLSFLAPSWASFGPILHPKIAPKSDFGPILVSKITLAANLWDQLFVCWFVWPMESILGSYLALQPGNLATSSNLGKNSNLATWQPVKHAKLLGCRVVLGCWVEPDWPALQHRVDLAAGFNIANEGSPLAGLEARSGLPGWNSCGVGRPKRI